MGNHVEALQSGYVQQLDHISLDQALARLWWQDRLRIRLAKRHPHADCASVLDLHPTLFYDDDFIRTPLGRRIPELGG